MEKIMRWHLEQYPKCQPCDAVKLLYQSEFGGGHLLNDRAYAMNRLKSEIKNTKQTEVLGVQEIGGGLVRFALNGAAASGLSVETITGLFAETCQTRGTMEGFEDKLACLTAMAQAGETPFSAAQLAQYLQEYRAQGMPAVSHSEEYRQAYAPAYRLMPAAVVKFLPLFARIDALLERKEAVLVKIEGGSASGKSTLGTLLQRVYQAQLFHMDDFFLPMARKTPERLAEPGGNVDYERFLAEIDQTPLGQAVRYQPYSCQHGALQPWETVPAARVRIVEGAYSMHPALSRPDVGVYLQIDEEKQKQRILERNGQRMLERFVREWIPLEQKYFAAFDIQKQCDLCFEA